MTTDKHKAALDALKRICLKAHLGTGTISPAWDAALEADKQRVIQALTAQAEAQPAEDDVREAVEELKENMRLGREAGYDTVPYLTYEEAETLIRAATAPEATDAPGRTCNGDPETCADVPDARRVYGFHNGKALSCHPPGVESAIETFLRFNGAVFVDGKPVEKFGISTGAMSSAIQAYLDYYRNGVGDTDETRKSY